MAEDCLGHRCSDMFADSRDLVAEAIEVIVHTRVCFGPPTRGECHNGMRTTKAGGGFSIGLDGGSRDLANSRAIHTGRRECGGKTLDIQIEAFVIQDEVRIATLPIVNQRACSG